MILITGITTVIFDILTAINIPVAIISIIVIILITGCITNIFTVIAMT